MDDKHFTEDDQSKLIDFLNMVATKAKFEFDTAEVIKYFKLLLHMQKSILPKLNDHILEVKAIHIPKEEK